MKGKKKIKLLEVALGSLIDGTIRMGQLEEMPSIQTGWVFNFDKHIKIPNSKTYILITVETPDVIEGCLVFEMKDKIVPYLAYIEIASHNKNNSKKYDYVAGCLIAFACELSFVYGKGHNQGYLVFDVMEENEENKKKLMTVYVQKYRALATPFISSTSMLITAKNGRLLIQEYLER